MKYKYFKEIFLAGLIIFLNLLNSDFKALSQEKNKNDLNISSIDSSYLKRTPSQDYILGPGDNLYISVSQQYPELDTVVTIDGNGTIILPKIYKVYVSGLTLDELNKLLDQEYSKYVKFPNVQSQIRIYRPLKILIEGEVENPGLYVLEGYTVLATSQELPLEFKSFNQVAQDDISALGFSSKKFQENAFKTFYFPTVFDAIRRSGGLTMYSNLSEIQLIRRKKLSEGGGLKKTTLDFVKINEGEISQNIRIFDGDIIKVKKLSNPNSDGVLAAIKSNINPKFINVYVSGRVYKPGKVTLPKISTLNDALLLAGGPKVIKGPINLISFYNDGTINKRKIRYRKNAPNGSSKNPFLKSNDVIFVDANILNTSSEVLQEVTAPFADLLSAYGLIKAFD